MQPFSRLRQGNGEIHALVGTFNGFYEAADATGKYGSVVGRKFPARGLAANAAKGPAFGASCVEVYEDVPTLP